MRRASDAVDALTSIDEPNDDVLEIACEDAEQKHAQIIQDEEASSLGCLAP